MTVVRTELAPGEEARRTPFQPTDDIPATDVQEAIEAVMAASIGTGDVDGPASATDNALARFDGTAGKLLQNSLITSDDTGITNGATAFGINATADTTNRLSVNSTAILFNHAGAGTQIKVNKNASGDTASYLFQTGFSGRAEFGAIGDNDFTLKTSPDGSAFTTALIVSNSDGALRVGINLRPSANDGAALGTTTVGWADLHGATGFTWNIANGNAVVTHSSGIFTVSTGDWRITTAGTNAASAVTVGGTQTLTSKTIALGSNTVSGTLAQFNTAVTDADLASLAGSETLTNKTVNLGSNTLTGTTAQFNTALSDNDFATQAGSETLTNKTIALGSNTVSGTTAQFNTALSDGDFATLAGSETLTNKTLTTPIITDPTITLSDDGAGAGPTLLIDRVSASPAANDVLGQINIQGRDNTGGTTVYAALDATILDATAGSEDGELRLRARINDSNTVIMRISGQGARVSASGVGLGYATGAGGTVTQATSKSTGVTLNTACGTITMNNANLNANTTVSFTFTNSVIAATDQIICEHISGGTLFNYSARAVAGAGSATVSLRNITAGNLADAVVLRFTVLKTVDA